MQEDDLRQIRDDIKQYELRSESVRVQMPKTRVVELLAL